MAKKTVPDYLKWINDSVEATRRTLARHELLQYMIDDTPGIDGDKAERDKISNAQAYELSVYSTLLEVQGALQLLADTGKAKAIKLSQEEETLDIEKLLGINKGGRKAKVTIVDGINDVPEEDREDLIKALEDTIKKLKEDK